MANESYDIDVKFSSRQMMLLRSLKGDMEDDLVQRIDKARKEGADYLVPLQFAQLENILEIIDDIVLNDMGQSDTGDFEELGEYVDEIIMEHSEEYDDEDVAIESASTNTGSVVVFKVTLIDNKQIYRKIAIRTGQTLHDLHSAIFKAFDRFDEHLYTFFIPNTAVKNFDPGTVYRSSMKYSHPYALEESIFSADNEIDAAMTPLEDVRLKPKDKLFYLFDFGDEWWHELTVLETAGEPDTEKYPRIIESKGESPAQYYDEEEEDWDDDDEQW